jgi:ribosome-binding factor A
MGRMERVNQLMKREISQLILSELRDPRLEFVSITHVEVSPDLHHAKISFSVLGNQQKVDEVRSVLTHAGGYIRRLVSQNLTLRFTPDLEFVYDPSIAFSAGVEQALKEIHDKNAGDSKNNP